MVNGAPPCGCGFTRCAGHPTTPAACDAPATHVRIVAGRSLYLCAPCASEHEQEGARCVALEREDR